MADESISAAEVYRRLDDFKADIGKRLDRIENRFDALNFVHEDRYVAEQAALNARVAALEESKKWGARTVAEKLIGLAVPCVLGYLAAKGVG